MDPITAAIIAALSAGAAGGLTDAAKTAISDGYDGLKTLIKKKFGSNSEAAEAVDKFEETPDSPKRKDTLVQVLKDANISSDLELLQAGQSLLDLIKRLPRGEQHVQFARGSGIAQADRSSTATVNLPGSPSSPWLGKNRGDD